MSVTEQHLFALTALSHFSASADTSSGVDAACTCSRALIKGLNDTNEAGTCWRPQCHPTVGGSKRLCLDIDSSAQELAHSDAVMFESHEHLQQTQTCNENPRDRSSGQQQLGQFAPCVVEAQLHQAEAKRWVLDFMKERNLTFTLSFRAWERRMRCLPAMLHTFTMRPPCFMRGVRRSHTALVP